MCHDIGAQNNDASPVVPPPGPLVGGRGNRRNDSQSAGTVSVMVVFTDLPTGALSRANGPRRLFITISHR